MLYSHLQYYCFKIIFPFMKTFLKVKNLKKNVKLLTMVRVQKKNK